MIERKDEMDERESILIVDEDESSRRILALIFREKGYEAETAETGREALEKARDRFFNLALLDIQLSDLEDVDLIVPLKQICPDTAVVAVTAWASLEAAVRALSEGAAAYISKPLNMDQVLAVVGEAVEKQQLLREKRKAEEALRESHKKMESLNQMARQLGACETEGEVFQLTVDAAERILDFSIRSLKIEEGNKLVVKATSPRSPREAAGARDPSNRGPVGRTRRTDQGETSRGSHETRARGRTQEGYESGISVPIGDKVMFQLSSAKPGAVKKDDARLLEMLLGHTAEALKRVRSQNELKEQAIYDPLTGVYNRYYLNQALEQEIERCKRYNHAIAFLMVDINRFKEINDRFGHQTGDRVLQMVASSLTQDVRRADVVARYGGDEFLIMLPETDGDTDSVKRRIADNVAHRNGMPELLDFPVTVSIGSAHWSPEGSESVEEVLSRADRRMYEDKNGPALRQQSDRATAGPTREARR